MNGREALAFVKARGIVLMSARGPVPNLAEAIAGEPIAGSWWGHPKSRHLYQVFETVRDSRDVLVCRLVDGKVTFVHRRLWPALVRLAGQLPKRGLAAIREEHTDRGRHRTVVTAFPRWVPREAQRRAKGLSVAQAVSQIGSGLVAELTGRTFVKPDQALEPAAGGKRGAPHARIRTPQPRRKR